MRVLTAFSIIGILFVASVPLSAAIAYADKLAPPPNKLQPLPANVQPAVSENVQRSASPEDIQNAQQAANSEPSPDSSVAPTNAPIQYNISSATSSNTGIIVIIIVVLIALAAAIIWLWRTF